jgi:hypothetical protein
LINIVLIVVLLIFFFEKGQILRRLENYL